ncbi:TRAP transporter large permease subunit [Alcaligenaceae bacterium CGII-47]|nr:TRAP transporter large permease subunit [Alcaligenaceae bacterium CGII-47]
MGMIADGFIVLFVLLLLLGGGVWVSLSLAGVSLVGMFLFTGAPIQAVMPTVMWSSVSSWTLAALPMFIWMGEILCRTRLATDLFHGLAPWLNRLPGGLLHINIVGCGLFAAVSGSSAATCATVGPLTLRELAKRGYDDRMAIGTLAGSGTLGLLIPPSILMIVYGVAANVSISRLFLAGVLPGLLVIVLFMSYVAIWATLNRRSMPAADAPMPLRERLGRLRLLMPVMALIVAVMGSIYMGLATATEAAAMGVAGALLIAALSGALTWDSFQASLLAATKTSCMIAFILAGAAFLSTVMGYAGIPRAMAVWIAAQDLPPYVLLMALMALYLVIGCFLEGASMVVLTAAFVVPMVREAGIDLVWFGIFIVIMVEVAQITPPVGFNLFVVQSLTPHGLFYVARSILPFLLLLFLTIGILMVFPQIALWLPNTMMNN